jgi:enamine deaminase RidA (YjgF/YER057c/UK114 family)
MSIKRIEPGKRMSGAVVHGNTVYLAGQVGEGASVTEQSKSALAEVGDRLLAAAGSDKSKILQTIIWRDRLRIELDLDDRRLAARAGAFEGGGEVRRRSTVSPWPP